MNFKKIFLFLSLILSSFNIIFSVDWLITNSGTYQLDDDILSSGDSNGTIRIRSSYVTLDLNGCFIQQTTNTRNCTGILIDPGYTDITIKNGTLYNFTGTGIAVQPGCQRVTLDNILTNSCFACAISLQGTTSSPVSDSYIKNCQIIYCGNYVFNTIEATRQASCPVWLGNCNRVYVGNNTFSNIGLNQSPSSANVPAGALELDACNSCLVENTNFYNVTNYFCAVNLDQYNFTGAGSFGCIIRNCVLDTGSSCNGFSLFTGQNNLFQNCTVTNISSISSAEDSIFYAADSYNIFDNCRFINSALVFTTLNSIVVFSATTYCSFIDCLISNVSVNGSIGFSGYGLASNSYANRCKIINNTSSNAISFNGFFISGGATNAEIVDCESSNNSWSAGTCTGLTCSATSTYSKVFNSIFTRNNGSTDANSFGISVSATSTNNLFVRNVAFANGPTSPLIANQLSGLPIGSTTTPGGGGAGTASNRIASAMSPWTNLRITN